jgi:hypothetical protein
MADGASIGFKLAVVLVSILFRMVDLVVSGGIEFDLNEIITKYPITFRDFESRSKDLEYKAMKSFSILTDTQSSSMVSLKLRVRVFCDVCFIARLLLGLAFGKPPDVILDSIENYLKTGHSMHMYAILQIVLDSAVERELEIHEFERFRGLIQESDITSVEPSVELMVEVPTVMSIRNDTIPAGITDIEIVACKVSGRCLDGVEREDCREVGDPRVICDFFDSTIFEDLSVSSFHLDPGVRCSLAQCLELSLAKFFGGESFLSARGAKLRDKQSQGLEDVRLDNGLRSILSVYIKGYSYKHEIDPPWDELIDPGDERYDIFNTSFNSNSNTYTSSVSVPAHVA